MQVTSNFIHMGVNCDGFLVNIFLLVAIAMGMEVGITMTKTCIYYYILSIAHDPTNDARSFMVHSL